MNPTNTPVPTTAASTMRSHGAVDMEWKSVNETSGSASARIFHMADMGAVQEQEGQDGRDVQEDEPFVHRAALMYGTRHRVVKGRAASLLRRSVAA